MTALELEWLPTFLRVSNQHPLACARDDIPYPDSAIIASRNERSASRGKSTDSMVVAFQVQLMVWVILDVLL